MIGGWWARGAAFPLPASHWRFEEPVILHCPSDPLGELAEGAPVVGRGIELGGGHVALVGRPVVVDERWLALVEGNYVPLERSRLIAFDAAGLARPIDWPSVE